jgi:hypothetical protein
MSTSRAHKQIKLAMPCRVRAYDCCDQEDAANLRL